jgi:rhamnogalacturonan acetylesterase
MNAKVMQVWSFWDGGQSNLLKLALLGAGLFLAGCKSVAPAPSAAISPQDFANMDVQHDRTSYQSSFSADTNRTLPILFIVGDSTVHNSSGGRVGWGDVIGSYFDTNKILVENHALAGRSSRTFITQGWWNLVLKEAKPGDFVLLQMGHNDGGPLDDPNRARGTIPGIGDEQKEIFNPVTQKPEIVHTYGWYLRQYISDSRAKGMTPILCSPVPHVPKKTVEAGDVGPSRYVGWSGEVATNENAPFLNLNRIVMSHYFGMSPLEIKEKYFTPQDNTHFNAAGAELNAESVVAGLRELDCPLKNYLLNEPAAKSR